MIKRTGLFLLAAMMVLSFAVQGAPEPEAKANAPKKEGKAKRQPNKNKRKPSPAMAPIVDQAGLPRVLLIGDSISIGYTIPTRKLLDGKANVHRIPTNGGDTRRGLKSLDKWLGDKPWDVIHFNWGLHDLKRLDGKTCQVTVEDYERNLRELVTKLKATNSKLVWCMTTPVPKGDLKPVRSNDDVIAYNAAAKRVMEENGIPIDDLYSFALPLLATIQRPVNVHFTGPGSAKLAEKVAAEILKALGQ